MNGGSDHLPTQITINEEPVCERSDETKFNMKKTDWIAYRTTCKLEINENKIHTDQLTYDTIVTAINKAAGDAIPKRTASGRKLRKMVPFWNERCKMATQEKRRARNEMNRRCNLETCTKFRELKAKAQRTIREEQKNYWRDYCSTLNEESKMRDVWRTSKKMVGAYKNRGIPTIIKQHQKHTTNKDKADAIARCLLMSVMLRIVAMTTTRMNSRQGGRKQRRTGSKGRHHD